MRFPLLCSLLALLLLITGCNTSTKPIAITLVSPTGTQALDLGQTVNLSVTVANDGQNKGVNFMLSGVGTLSNQSPAGATYTAPATGAGGTASILITSATDPTKTMTVTIVVTPAPTITTGSLPATTEGAAYSATIAVTGGAGTMTYSVTAGGGSLPPGLSLNSSTGAITGTATGPNKVSTFTVQVKDSSTVSPQTSTKALSIAVNLPAPPVITPAALPADVEGTAYSQTIAVTGGLAPFTYSISTGALPTGLNISSSTGAITGTPTGPSGLANFKVMVVDSSNPAQSSTQAFSILVNLPAAPKISTTSLPGDVEGTAYNQTIAATGYGTLAYSISGGILPAGLTLNSSTGAITGTPAGPNGAANFAVKVTDGSNPVQSITQMLSIAINLPPAPVISTSSLPGVVEFASYNQTVAATGYAPLVYSLSSGALPAGLSLNSSTGAITGSPTGPNGTANFTVKVTDASNPVQTFTKLLSIAVSLPPAPAISTTSLPGVVEFAGYNQTVVATGYAPLVYSLSSGALPAGLSLNSSTGAITGSPTGPNGTANFTVKVTDASNPVQTFTKLLSIAVSLPPAPAISTTSLPGVVEFAGYNQTVVATGYAPLVYSLSSGALPAGLSLNSSTGAITGSPTGPSGTANFTVKVTDASNPPQTISQPLSIAVSLPPAPSITTTSLPNATVGGLYTQTVAFTGGQGPFTWSISAGALPVPMVLNPSTGVISGTPPNTSLGTAKFTVKVVDSSNLPQSSIQPLSISVVTGPLLVAPATLPTGAVGDVYPSTLIGASGGVPPYTFSVFSAPSTFPAGLNLSSGGQITGTPTSATGSPFNFTAQVKDSTNATNTGSFSITVNPVLAVTTTSLPGGTQGNAYPSTNLNASGGVTPYTWSISSGSLPTGLSFNGNVISGVPTVSGTFPLTFTVTDASGGTAASSGLSIVLAPAPPLSVTTTSGSLPTGTLNAAYPATQLNASGGIQPYTWLLITGPLPPGMSLSSSGQISGTPTSTGTYPFTVQVSDSIGGMKQAALSITVNALTTTCNSTLTGKESLLHGDYAFMLRGFDSSANPAFVGGVFVASGVAGAGNITSGTLDLNLNAGVQSNLSFASASGYTLGQDSSGGYRGCMTIVTSAGTQHYAFTVDGIGANTAGEASNGHIINFDTIGPFTAGVLRQANSSAFSTGSITGNWAFGIAGPKAAAHGGGKFSAAGVITFASGSVSGVADANTNGFTDGSTVVDTAFPATAGITLSSGAYSIASNGRGTMSFTPTGSSSAVNSFIYVVSSSELLAMSADNQTGVNASNGFNGRAFKQSGTFSTSSLTGNHVIYSSGPSTNTSGGNRTELDLVSTSGSNFTFAGYQNDSGTTQDPTTNSGSGTFSVASNGRATLVCGACGHLPVFYLYGANTGFFLSADHTASSGLFVPQTGSSFSNSSASGTYGFGTYSPDVSGISDESGMATFTPGTASIAGISDKNAQGTLKPNSSISSTYAIGSTGVGLLPSGCTLIGVSANCEDLFIVISPTQAVLMNVNPTNTAPSVQVVEQ